MTSTLILPTNQTPFPYAACAIAAYTGSAAIVFDDGASGLTLTSNASNLSDEAAIVQVLATEGGLAENSEKVRTRLSCQVSLRIVLIGNSHKPSSLRPNLCSP